MLLAGGSITNTNMQSNGIIAFCVNIRLLGSDWDSGSALINYEKIYHVYDRY